MARIVTWKTHGQSEPNAVATLVIRLAKDFGLCQIARRCNTGTETGKIYFDNQLISPKRPRQQHKTTRRTVQNERWDDQTRNHHLQPAKFIQPPNGPAYKRMFPFFISSAGRGPALLLQFKYIYTAVGRPFQSWKVFFQIIFLFLFFPPFATPRR